MKNILTLLLTFGLCWGSLKAQSPAPGAAQEKGILIINGTAHIGNGKTISSAAILLENGKITSISSSSDFNGDQSQYEVVDANGQHVYPGFILPNTDLGLREVSAVRATVDADETGDLNPNIRSISSYNTDSELIPTLRFTGILAAQITPQGGTISGTSSVVHLDAWNWEDAIIKQDEGIHIFWPAKKLSPRWWMGETKLRLNEKYDQSIADLEALLNNATVYAQSKKETNLKLEALQGLLDGSKKLFLHVNKANAIVKSVEFAKSFGIKEIVLVGANDVMYVKDYVKENNLSIILDDIHRLPSRLGEDVDLPYRLPKLLSDEGIKFCLSYSGVANSRNLPFFAGTSVAYGMDKEAALRSISLDAAEILGVSSSLGSLEKGKDATLFISNGDALDMKSNIISNIWVQGRKVTLEALQQRLYKKYKKKYGLEN